jgi:hypothetical protein
VKFAPTLTPEAIATAVVIAPVLDDGFVILIEANTVLPLAATPVLSVSDAAILRNAEPVGEAVTRATNVKVSAIVAVSGRVTVTGTVVATPTWAVGIVPTTIAVGSIAAALADTLEIIPKPKAATVTSAMRLKVVFVDICFLSISRSREFP